MMTKSKRKMTKKATLGESGNMKKAPIPEEKDDTDDEDTRTLPPGYQKVDFKDEPAAPVIFKKANAKQRNIRKGKVGRE